MSNADVLKAGTAKAKKMIEEHIVNQILIPTANDMLAYVVEKRSLDGHNMTGNTINSYVVGVFAGKNLVYMKGSWEDVPQPLTHKVYFYHAGRQRWDGEVQKGNFPTKGAVNTNGKTEPDRTIAFIQSYQANPKGFTLVVANGIEYATFEENVYGADTLTESLEYFNMYHSMHFKPIPA